MKVPIKNSMLPQAQFSIIYYTSLQKECNNIENVCSVKIGKEEDIRFSIFTWSKIYKNNAK